MFDWAWPYVVQSEAMILPFASAPILTSHRFAMPQWSQPCWSQRIHCTRTGALSLADSATACSLTSPVWPPPNDDAPSYQTTRTFCAGMVPPVTKLITPARLDGRPLIDCACTYT